MAQRAKVMIWSELFGGRASFHAEIEHAREIGAKWSANAYQRGIVLDEIPGWLEPMWATDSDWLYLRRPEGVWKARIPQDFEGCARIWLSQRRSDAQGRIDVLGMLSLGCWWMAAIISTGPRGFRSTATG